MPQLYTIYRAPDGLRKTINRKGDVDLYLPAPAVQKLWAGMKKAEPNLAAMFNENPVVQLLMKQTDARPCFTADQLQAFNAAAEGNAE